MTREEELRQEIDLQLAGSFGNYSEGYEEGFIEGAKWADEHSQKSNGVMKYWIARDEDGELYLFDEEPKLHKNYLWSTSTECGRSFRLDSNLFNEVTFENSPQEVELK